MIIITGSGGLIGSSAVRAFAPDCEVIGIDNDSRRSFFGNSASTATITATLADTFSNFRAEYEDIRNRCAIEGIFAAYADEITAIIHCAAQPSHDWAACDPFTDFDINAVGTLNLLEATRRYCPKAAFVFMSTNKVYGDWPNWLNGDLADESIPIDQCTHSIFGASKVAADIMVQEYGRYFGMNTVCFRGGCLTGGAHAGAEQHGFLAYLVKCCKQGIPYTIYGYDGKQVRDNIHADDVVSAMREYIDDPDPAAVYNIGGGPENAISVREAITKVEEMTGKKMDVRYVDEPRKGDHIWYVTDMTKFKTRYPKWQKKWSLDAIFDELVSV